MEGRREALKKLGRAVRTIRCEHGLSHEQVGELAGCSASSIRKLEFDHSKMWVGEDAIRTLAAAFAEPAILDALNEIPSILERREALAESEARIARGVGTVSDVLRVERALRFLTLGEIAERAGLHRQTVEDLESGRRKMPSVDTVHALEKVFGMSLKRAHARQLRSQRVRQRAREIRSLRRKSSALSLNERLRLERATSGMTLAELEAESGWSQAALAASESRARSYSPSHAMLRDLETVYGLRRGELMDHRELDAESMSQLGRLEKISRTLGDSLRLARLRARYYLCELASVVEVSRVSLSYYERDIRRPSPRTLEAVAAECRVPQRDLSRWHDLASCM